MQQQAPGVQMAYVLFQALHEERPVLKVETYLVASPKKLGEGFLLTGRAGAELLRQMIETGRCHWASQQSPALTLGHLRKARMEWLKEPSGLQRMNCRVMGDRAMILMVAPPWYLDQVNHTCGPLDTGVAPELAMALLSAPPLKPEQIRRVYQLLEQRPISETPEIPEASPVLTTVLQSSESEFYVSIQEDADLTWFDLELGIMVDGVKMNLLPLLVDSIRKGQRVTGDSETWMIQLDNGRLASIPLERVRNILDVLIELHERDALTQQGKLRLSRWQAVQLSDLKVNHWFGGDQLRKLGDKLRQFSGIKQAAVPVEFNTTLRPYQQVGLDWLQFLREYELGGILADDMGLGKTVQALAHILLEKNSGRMDRPSLVIAPTSLMTNWRLEAERFAPDLRVLVLHGSDRKQHFGTLHEYDVIITTYPLLVRDTADLQEVDYHLLILDEAQVIKNPVAQATQRVRGLRARHRICLTGTPLENHLGELWSLFHFLMPGLLGERRQFNRLFRIPIEKQGDTKRRQALMNRIMPFLLRRTKEAVAKELPPKTEIVQTVEMIGGQRDLYESVRLSLHHKVAQAIQDKGLGGSQIIILDALLKLRQVCCDPRLLKLDSAKNFHAGSAKLELLLEMLVSLIEEGRRVLLFSQFTSMLDIIEAEIKRKGISYVMLTGKTKKRAPIIDKFQSGEVPLFLISLKAGGTGLNLTAADTVIHYDPWWNPAVENQATDRAHRIGQDKPVFVYKLLTVGTVEEKIQALQQKKHALTQGLFLNDTASLTKEDFEDLFT